MTAIQIVTKASGGAFLGIFAVRMPLVFGFAWQPSARGELVAGAIGALLAIALIAREKHQKRKRAEALKFGR